MTNLFLYFRWPGAWAENDYPFMQYALGSSIEAYNETLFINATIRNLTFDGIDSDLLHMGDVPGMLGDMLDNQIPFDRFGWFYDVGLIISTLRIFLIFYFKEKQFRNIRRCLSNVLWSG